MSENLAEPSESDLSMVRDIFDAEPFDRETVIYVVAAALATERREAAELVRKFAAQIEARLIVTADRPLEQAQMIRNAPEALRALAKVVEE